MVVIDDPNASRPLTSELLALLRRILPDGGGFSDGAIIVDDNYWRAGPSKKRGEWHGGYDFFYTPVSGLNGNGNPNVYILKKNWGQIPVFANIPSLVIHLHQ